MRAPIASRLSSRLSHVELAVIRVPPVAATPFPGRMMTLNLFGAANPSLGSMATIFGYHSASAGANLFSPQSFKSVAWEVSIEISQYPFVEWMTNGASAATEFVAGFPWAAASSIPISVCARVASVATAAPMINPIRERITIVRQFNVTQPSLWSDRRTEKRKIHSLAPSKLVARVACSAVVSRHNRRYGNAADM